MPIALTNRSRNVPIRRRIEIKVQTFARTLANAAFHFRYSYGKGLIAAWEKAKVTL
jgi:hypothetical protein